MSCCQANTTVMSESTTGTMSNCSQSQSVFPPNSLSVHGLRPSFLSAVCLPFSSTMTDTITVLDEFTMNQYLAYPSNTTTCRPILRAVTGLRCHSRGSQGRSMQDPASELPRIPIPRTPVNKLSMAVRDSTVCPHYSVDKPRARREESMTSTNIIRWGGIAAMLGCLYSSSHCNLLSFASTSATIERRQPCPRTRRTPVATSQTSQAASPATPTNSSGEPSAMARLPTPATSSRLPPAAASRRCHGGVSRLACVASAAPMNVAPSAGSDHANAAACICQASSNTGLGSVRSPADSTTPSHRTA